MRSAIRMNSDPFSQALVRRYCSLRPGSGCRLRSEERDATEEHEFSHIVLSAARPAASTATAVPHLLRGLRPPSHTASPF